MAISAVHLESDAFLVCLTHALTTEREEVMGLLIGEIDEKRVSNISAVIVLRRSDKQPDRVEISPEQLSDASTKAEMLGQELQRPMRVLGWYHSHPHITVWPSHVDVRTQAAYQMMDDGFIGLIFSVFNEEKTTKVNRIQVICFQSVSHGSGYKCVEVPLLIKASGPSISKVCLDSLIQLPHTLSQEEEEAYQQTKHHGVKMDLVSKVHNSSVYCKSLCHIMEVLSGPLLQLLECRQQQQQQRIASLARQREELLAELQALSQDV